MPSSASRPLPPPVFATLGGLPDAAIARAGKAYIQLRARRWRVIILGAGFLLAYAVYLWGSTSSPTPPEDKESPKKTLATHVTPQDESMFEQYQAVGLGNETLKEAYAPVPRSYVPPTNGDIYSTFGIVIASFSPHALMLSRFFDSMVKFCLDCHRVRIVLIIPATELDVFTNIQGQFREELPNIEVVPFSHVFPALNATLAERTHGWPHGWTGWDEERLLRSKDRALFQSFKKLYGCLYLATEYCMILDSEGFFIRQATLADIYGGTRKSPYVIYGSHVRRRWPFTESAKALLGYYGMGWCKDWGWTLEEYNWSLDNNILAEVERIFRHARPNLDDMEPLVFIEVVYWIFIIHNHHKYPWLRIIDSVNLFGAEAYNNMRKISNFEDGAFTPYEDLRWYMEKDPSFVDVGVQVYNKFKFKFFKTRWSKESIEFLERAHSVVLCVSEQPENVYKLAMKGHFNQTLGSQAQIHS